MVAVGLLKVTIMGWPGIALPPGLAHSPQGENINTSCYSTQFMKDFDIRQFCISGDLELVGSTVEQSSRTSE